MLTNIYAAVVAVVLCFRLIYRRVHRNNHALAVFIFKEGDSSVPDLCRCTVCLNDITGGDRCRRLSKCGHCFHADCIDTWISGYSSTCPLCRCDVVVHRLIGRKEQGQDDAGDDHDDESWSNLYRLISICRKILQRVANSLCDEISAAICTNLH